MSARLRRGVAIGVTLASLAVCAGCTSVLPNFSGQQNASEDTPPVEDTGATPEELTCESMIAPNLVTEFESIGWSAQSKPFNIGPTELTDGLVCTWANYDTNATEILQMYGWAPLAEGQAATEADYLESEGWIREEADGVVYLTEAMPPETFADDQGYGLTYAFHDSWVAYADTKAGLDVIVWRPAD